MQTRSRGSSEIPAPRVSPLRLRPAFQTGRCALDGTWDPPPRRLAIFRALKLGDMLCAVPAFRALRAAFPGAEITLVGLPWAREFVDRYRSYLDGFREFPGYPGLPERGEPDVARIPAFLAEMRAERFDLAIQMHGNGSVSNAVTAAFGARVNVGFYEPGRECPDAATFLPYPGRGLELRRLLRLLEHLGIPPRGESLEFPIREEDRRQARRIAGACGLGPRTYVCIHPGASVPDRRWSPGRFAAVADALASRGLSIALTGTSGETGLTREVARAMRAPAIVLAGRTALGPLAALLADASLLVCNDTGVSHLADALRVPSVVVSTGDNPDRWAPADRRLHRVLCRDSGVEPDEVIAEAEALLGGGSSRPIVGASRSGMAAVP
jgi:ADP-heptose:LPS heptosyltransferase